ncbi:hypothetical protein I302_107979 [Kwoniella bestiolae CBS 10118]|uniref:L-serine ammonia-lyase n=1 Tax=Kwoniella bestiolae CBS 10118 TaxID=1296100 RepID=A0A1B9FX06_9TREE|nr:L-serine ammonia-lyase [Kwoniella bestiolae CBS 10118]OCF23303.1 L-serine ammonia-lyase [Kwoniella bestiolae CBS 10118]
MTVMPLTPPAESILELNRKAQHLQDHTLKQEAETAGYPCPWIETPLIESAPLSKLAGCRIFLKMENFQPSGSFKSRGIGNLVLRAVQRSPHSTPRHFFSPSGGNAALACTTASTLLHQKSTVVVPTTTKPEMIQRILLAGASEVIQHGRTIAEADSYLRTELLSKDPCGVYVPPFDHRDIWDGAERLIHEVHTQMGGRPEGVVCSVGGGGLLIGLCQGLDRLSPSAPSSESPRESEARAKTETGTKTQVIGVETIGCESFSKAIKAQQLVTLPNITSIATSLGCTTVASKALEYGLRSSVHSTLVSDREAIEACIRFAEDHKVLVEPACGATLALVYSGRLSEVMQLGREDRVVLVVCGGSNVSVEMMSEWRRDLGV